MGERVRWQTKACCVNSAKALAVEGKVYFWTFTLRDCLPIPVAVRRWYKFRKAMTRAYPGLEMVRAYELHPGGHGLHVHAIVNQFMDIERVQCLGATHGWGRMEVQLDGSHRAEYIAKYISSAKREQALKGRRLWAAIGDNGGFCRVKDVRTTSPTIEAARAMSRNNGSSVWQNLNTIRQGIMMGLYKLADVTAAAAPAGGRPAGTAAALPCPVKQQLEHGRGAAPGYRVLAGGRVHDDDAEYFGFVRIGTTSGDDLAGKTFPRSSVGAAQRSKNHDERC